jgi:hypothetical protein
MEENLMNQTKNLQQYMSSAATPPTLDDLKQRATSGRAADVDFLMENLDLSRTFSRCKVIDYALSLVSSAEGQARLAHFLFNGSQVQRNYAALYFKRRGNGQLIDEAVQRGCIDEIQAYSV